MDSQIGYGPAKAVWTQLGQGELEQEEWSKSSGSVGKARTDQRSCWLFQMRLPSYFLEQFV